MAKIHLPSLSLIGMNFPRYHGSARRSFPIFQVGDVRSADHFAVRTISFQLLYGLVVLRHARRRLVTIGVTSNPTAEWISDQVTDAFPSDEAPRRLILMGEG